MTVQPDQCLDSKHAINNQITNCKYDKTLKIKLCDVEPIKKIVKLYILE